MEYRNDVGVAGCRGRTTSADGGTALAAGRPKSHRSGSGVRCGSLFAVWRAQACSFYVDVSGSQPATSVVVLGSRMVRRPRYTARRLSLDVRAVSRRCSWSGSGSGTSKATGAHALFRVESELNTVLFAGFPGLVSKLWLCHDQKGTYRGLYQWDDPELAAAYARALWRVLALVSEPGSIHYAVVPGADRDEVLEGVTVGAVEPSSGWWSPVGGPTSVT